LAIISTLKYLAQHCETKGKSAISKQYSSKSSYWHEKYAYKGNALATYDNSKNRRTAGIPFAKEILTVCAYL